MGFYTNCCARKQVEYQKVLLQNTPNRKRNGKRQLER